MEKWQEIECEDPQLHRQHRPEQEHQIYCLKGERQEDQPQYELGIEHHELKHQENSECSDSEKDADFHQIHSCSKKKTNEKIKN
jgi:hypothetical protein